MSKKAVACIPADDRTLQTRTNCTISQENSIYLLEKQEEVSPPLDFDRDSVHAKRLIIAPAE